MVDACVVRQPSVRRELKDVHRDLHLFVRNGMHEYDNQEHAMMPAMLAARSVLAGARLDEVWKEDENAQYHETAMRACARRSTASAWCPRS